MLFILIPIAWIAIVALVVMLCMAAARGDSRPARVVETADRPPLPRVLVWEGTAAPPAAHHARQRSPLAAGRRVRDRRLVHDVR